MGYALFIKYSKWGVFGIMNIAICDDSTHYINTMEGFLEKLNTDNLEYDVYMSGEELVSAYESNGASYDVIFLDMEMGELDGIDTANRIRQIDKYVIIIFVTSHTKYMQRSFECTPFRFLIKPIKFDDFTKVYGEIQIKLKDKTETVVFSENRNRIRLFCDDILFFESQAHQILIYTKDGKIHKIRKTITELMEILDGNMFFRVHRAFVVNLAQIYQILENDVLMRGLDKPIPLSRTYKKELTDKFLNFKERKYLL